MAQVVVIKNNTVSEQVFVGKTFAAGETFDISEEIHTWRTDSDVFEAVGSGTLVISDGTKDITDPVLAWNWLLGNTTPKSYLGDKVAVHSSAKPEDPNKDFYLVWTGAGDDLVNGVIGDGDILTFELSPGTASVTKTINFIPEHGDVYLHEAYAKWDGGSAGDHMDAIVVASASVLQQSVSLDLIIEDNWVKYSSGGPGTGTHGFAANPVLVPRVFSKDGDWDYDETSGLVPNFAGTGDYKISDLERHVHKYINKIPTLGNSYGFTCLTSDETAFLPVGYFLRITAYNVSDSNWNMCAFFEVYRQRTCIP